MTRTTNREASSGVRGVMEMDSSAVAGPSFSALIVEYHLLGNPLGSEHITRAAALHAVVLLRQCWTRRQYLLIYEASACLDDS